ncbi:hypothetical protein KEM48_014001 [Puccinia striiformis f. sp. tritici PST-130]|nr:hypothetical protein KEM48_014001 [Puccinia striiformis f. sp. tritici PST-130]
MPPQPPPAQPNPALIQQQLALQLQQQQIEQHILNITSGLTGSGAPIPPTLIHHQQQPSFAGGATLSAAPQPVSSRPPPLIDPGRAAMISGGSIPAQPPPPGSTGLGAPSDSTPPITIRRPNVPDFGAGIPGPQSIQAPAGVSSVPGSALTPMAAQLAIDNITNQASGIPGNGSSRPAEDDSLEGQPGAKKIKLSSDETSLSSNIPTPQPVVPQLFTEEQWIEIHPEPISLHISLPVYKDKPEWGCDGSEIVLEELPITLLVGVLRDKLSKLKGIPVGRQQIKLGNKILPNQVTLASLNFKNLDKLNLAIKESRKK